jgi:hypothetical protein
MIIELVEPEIEINDELVINSFLYYCIWLNSLYYIHGLLIIK